MPAPLLAAQTAPPIAIELSAAVTLLGVIAALFGVIGFFLHRELGNNDKAHSDLKTDVRAMDTSIKKLLEGDVAWVRALLERVPGSEAVTFHFPDGQRSAMRYTASAVRMIRLSSRIAGVAIVNSSRGFSARMRNSGPDSMTYVVPCSLSAKIFSL